MSTLSFQSIHMEHGGGLILSRKLPAIAIRNEMIIVGGESDCNYSTGNDLKKQKIEVSLSLHLVSTMNLYQAFSFSAPVGTESTTDSVIRK